MSRDELWNLDKGELVNRIYQLNDRITTLESEVEEAEAAANEAEDAAAERINAAEALAELAPNPDNIYDQKKAEYFRDHFARITLEELESIVESKNA